MGEDVLFCPRNVLSVSFGAVGVLPQSAANARHLMSTSATALLVVDVQESFRHRPYWRECDVPLFGERVRSLITGAQSRRIPVIQIFHVEESGPFSLESGHVVQLHEAKFTPNAVFIKRSHSAFVGSGVDVWLTQHGIRRVIVCGIRTEQCCETTSRHASDLGYEVDYVTEATLTFPMTDRYGREWTPEQIKARTELVLDDRFARIVTVEEALARSPLYL
jgi:nicotinamidase-related amidase